jgi:hypothetical protein
MASLTKRSRAICERPCGKKARGCVGGSRDEAKGRAAASTASTVAVAVAVAVVVAVTVVLHTNAGVSFQNGVPAFN